MTQQTHVRTIRSYVIRAGRITPRQKFAIDNYWSNFGLSVADGMQDLECLFGRSALTHLEIGFGMGDALIEMAENNPHINYLGVEVHPPGVGALLAQIVDRDLQNIRIYGEDVQQVLSACIPDESLDQVFVLFPDPWPKKRHHKRRLVRPEFVNLLWRKLKLAGKIHLATDITDYAEYILDTFAHCPQFINQFGAGNVAPERPATRPLTKFESRGQRLGHIIRDLVFTKSDKE